ncbi:acyl transferase domain-containing protein [Kockiozyma suomiensis]|uniref:acyl transferase domain-containing protein n=1 Tax=Kockiozyma suomiensis TaxID=1337062 RepID=UPI00334362D4
MYAGTETGVATPHTQASLRPLTLAHGPLEYTVFVPTALYLSVLHLRDEFTASLPQPTPELAGDDEPESTCELVALFLASIVLRVEETPGQYDDALSLVLADFETRFLRANEVHAVAAALPGTIEKREEVIRAYYAARLAANRPIKGHESALLRAVTDGRATVYAIFGGQGNIEEYFDELRSVYSLYHGLVGEFVQACADELLVLAGDDRTAKVYSNGLDIMRWLREPESTPDLDYLVSAPVSFPLIGVVQLTHYAATCRVLGKQPGELRSYLAGTTGHSQGVITAAAIAASSTWESFFEIAIKTMKVLFWTGCRAQQTYPRTSLTPSVLQDTVNEGEGKPSPMLSVRDLPKSQVQKHVDLTNSHLPEEKHVSISLENGARNFVVTGPPQSLYGLSLSLRKLRAPPGLEQNRIPYSQRKLKFSTRFLPITAPFHSPYVDAAYSTIVEDLKDVTLDSSELAIPVYDTFDGHDLREDNGSVVNHLVYLVTSLPVLWEKPTVFPNATHVVDFGPGGASGLGFLTHRNKEGTGVRIILGGALEGAVSELGFKPELFDREDSAVKFAANWGLEFAPKLVKTTQGKTYVDTQFSRLLGQPPIMVAGMTPSTVPADFVAATMNAGYHIELGGGGYFNANGLTKALYEIEKSIFPGAGITINLIYVNPRAMGWAIPLIQKLRAEGVPIEGLTIGAGVPSIEVANEYITTLGIKHLGLKPGSMDAIQQVIAIAQANPKFPIICQWTGGRGGGHHSYEDFHNPILQMYPRIRRCSNIILVAGSGFGGAEDTYPFLTGQWAVKFGFPPMPFDGALYGSRMMVAKEAHTSPGAKQAIVDAPGVDESQWENTYQKPTGGVITVLSEMGEPIHKLATRGVLFWKEMDTTIFSLPKNKRVEALKAKKDYIIKKLNADFQKVWFGQNASGVPMDLEDMTYGEIINRLVELLYIKAEKRWIDPSLRAMTGDFMRRVEERFTHETGVQSLLQSYTELDDPKTIVQKFFNAYPEAVDQIINVQDKEFFLMLSLRPGQKPVPFVPVLDDNFDTYFKKDSLWQSEDLGAVVGNDVQRTCILQGPVAARFATAVDEPVKDILDGINNKHIELLTQDVYGGDESKIPVIEYFGGKDIAAAAAAAALKADSVLLTETADSVTYTVSAGVSGSAALPSIDAWLSLLGGETYGWRHAFFTTDVFVQGTKYETNPLKRIFAPAYGIKVMIKNPSDNEKTRITVSERINGVEVVVIEAFKKDANTIEMTLYDNRTVEQKPVGLTLLYTYHPEVGFAPIREVMEGRNDRIKNFYWRLWFGTDPYPADMDITDPIDGGTVTVTSKDIADFVYAVGNNGEAFVDRPGKTTYAPMDFAIVVGWQAIIKAIFPKAIDGDLLKLVHLSNSFNMLPGAGPLQKGDVVATKAKINSVLNQDSGKMVEVSGMLSCAGKDVMEVTSQFLYRGVYTDYENTFQRKSELPMQITLNSAKDVAVLRSKDWFELNDEPHIDLLKQTIIFRLETFTRFKNKTIFSSVVTTGQVLLELPTREVIQIGSVNYEAGESHGNPVIDYLERYGSTIEQPVLFENSIPLNGSTELINRSPASNEGYARVSGDYNPIHVSRVFAAYANLPGNITHGMYSSASVRSLVETWAAENNISRVRGFNCSFVGMVLPNDDVETKLHHVGMIGGRKIIKVETTNKETGEAVLVGQAEVEQPVSTYIFTGQGSQEQGMGMDLYDSSPVARDVWDRADRHFLNNYGFSITNIVRNNPKEYTVHFGGPRGKAIRQNYTSMMFESVDADGNLKSEKIFKEITDTTTSYTFRSDTGLLSATQFTQPALTLMEKASFEDMKSKGLVPADCSYAGHSLGEYSALTALGDVMPIESLVDVVFYRGMTMQVAVPRDSLGRSNYGMCAVNPSRISKTFNDSALRYVVEHISQQTKWLLEIVNYNVENTQYVTAGDLRALDSLTNVLNFMKVQKIDLDKLMQTMSIEEVKEQLTEIVTEIAKKSEEKPQPIDLERGFATIPLKGISVPFHSSYLRSGVKPFQRFLLKKLPQQAVKPANLIGKYIPNLTAKPFSISKEYFQEVYDLTGSAKIRNILDNWEKYETA